MAQPELLFAVEDRRGGSRREERGEEEEGGFLEEEEGGFLEEEEDVDDGVADAATNALWRGAEAARAASPTGLAAAPRILAERLVAMARKTQQKVATQRQRERAGGSRVKRKTR
jgi:hypothetical protein